MISRNASKSNKDVQSVGGKRLILRLVSEPRSWIRILAGADCWSSGPTSCSDLSNHGAGACYSIRNWIYTSANSLSFLYGGKCSILHNPYC